MKKTCFILSLAGVAALAACSTQELESPANLQNGMLMVRPIVPEVEIETKADLPTIYAFIPEELNAGTVNPVLPKINSGNTYYYKPLIPESEYKRTFMSGFVRNYFANSYKEMVSFFAKEQKISAGELKDIIDMIEQGKEKE